MSFNQNIGALVMRFHNRVRGRLCKRCIHENFWKMTSITVLVGWLGVISIIIAPFLVLNNVLRYLFALGMPPVPPGARPPELTADAIERLDPHQDEIGQRLGRNEDLHVVAMEVAPQAGVTPGQVWAYVMAIAQAQAQTQAKSQAPRVVVPQSTGGFPVIPSRDSAAVASSAPLQPPPLPPASATPPPAPAQPPSLGITD